MSSLREKKQSLCQLPVLDVYLEIILQRRKGLVTRRTRNSRTQILDNFIFLYTIVSPVFIYTYLKFALFLYSPSESSAYWPATETRL